MRSKTPDMNNKVLAETGAVKKRNDGARDEEEFGRRRSRNKNSKQQGDRKEQTVPKKNIISESLLSKDFPEKQHKQQPAKIKVSFVTSYEFLFAEERADIDL